MTTLYSVYTNTTSSVPQSDALLQEHCILLGDIFILLMIVYSKTFLFSRLFRSHFVNFETILMISYCICTALTVFFISHLVFSACLQLVHFLLSRMLINELH
jgi:hypothetical protein